MRVAVQVMLAAMVGFSGVGGRLTLPDKGTSMFSAAMRNCNIKGNVSIGSGERIFHVPGQKYYADTVIRPEYGELWFWQRQKRVQLAGDGQAEVYPVMLSAAQLDERQLGMVLWRRGPSGCAPTPSRGT